MSKIKEKVKKFLIQKDTVKILLHIIFNRVIRKKIYFIIGIPVHGNLGDQAIAFAEKNFILENINHAAVIELRFIDENYLFTILRKINKYIKSDDIICGHGGGNIGNWYLREEELRRFFIKLFSQNKIIIFPQSIFFENNDLGKQQLEISKQVYQNHKRLFLLLREEESYQLANKIFDKSEKFLVPDIVTYLQPKDNYSRNKTLICMRNDKEKNTNTELTVDYIVDICKKIFFEIEFTDTVIENKVIYTKRQREIALRKKWTEFGKAKLIITDRLHGLIFAAITNTPCIAMANASKKVEGTYTWLKNYPQILFVKDRKTFVDSMISLSNLSGTTLYNRENLRQYWKNIAEILQ